MTEDCFPEYEAQLAGLKGSDLLQQVAQKGFPFGAWGQCPRCLKECYLTTEEVAGCLAAGWPVCCGGKRMLIEAEL